MDDPLTVLHPLLLSANLLSPGIILGLVFVIILLLISASIAAMEVGFFSLSPSHISELENSTDASSHRVLQLLQKPKSLIATIVVSHNLVNIGVVILSESLSETLFHFPDNPGLLFFLKVVVVTFFIVLVGEVIPKIYTNADPVSMAKRLAIPLALMQSFFKPLNYLLIRTSSYFDKHLAKNQATLSVEDLSQALELTSNEHTPEEERKILEGIVEFGNTEVKEIMRPRMDIIAIEINIPFHTVLEMLSKNGFSRVPVYSESLDKVEGILVMKDLLPHLHESDHFDWKTLIRKPYFIPAGKKIDDLLREFQRMKNHMALVIDEYGGTMGLVTLEDVLEEVLGEINDEFDDDELVYSRIDDSTYIFEGKIALNDFYRVLQVEDGDFEAHRGEADTLAGFMLELSGKIPARNEKIIFGKYTFVIESADFRKINRIKVQIGETGQPPLSKNSRSGALHSIVCMLGLSMLLMSCGSEYPPKPRGYFRIDFPQKEYQTFSDSLPYSFEFPKYAKVEPYTGSQKQKYWINLSFPGQRATLHLSYHSLQNDLVTQLNDSRELAYKHTVKANSIDEEPLSFPEKKVYGLVYRLSGNTASSTQFYLTDSTQHFIRGALYFHASPNADSLAPVSDFLQSDIYRFIQTFKWK